MKIAYSVAKPLPKPPQTIAKVREMRKEEEGKCIKYSLKLFLPSFYTPGKDDIFAPAFVMSYFRNDPSLTSKRTPCQNNACIASLTANRDMIRSYTVVVVALAYKYPAMIW